MACWRSEWIDENRRETEKKSEETLLERQFFFEVFFHMFFHVFSYWLNERVKQTMGWSRGRGHEKTDHPVSRCWQVEIFQCLRGVLGGCVCVWTIWKDVKLLTCLMMCFNGFPIWHCLFGFFIWFSNKSRGARPSVTTLPNEAMSLKGKQLGTPSCVPADSF